MLAGLVGCSELHPLGSDWVRMTGPVSVVMPSRISTESTSIRPWCSTSQALTTTARHGSYARSVTAISHIVLVSWKSGSHSAVEDLVRPAIRGFVDTIPDVQSVVEGHSSSPEGLEDYFDYGFVVTSPPRRPGTPTSTTRSTAGSRGDWGGLPSASSSSTFERVRSRSEHN